LATTIIEVVGELFNEAEVKEIQEFLDTNRIQLELLIRVAILDYLDRGMSWDFIRVA